MEISVERLRERAVEGTIRVRKKKKGCFSCCDGEFVTSKKCRVLGCSIR